MDAKTNRRNNLRYLVAQTGGQVEVAKRVDTDPAYLSQVLANWKGRGVGDALARRIETAFGKPVGWMDQAHDQKPIPAEVVVHGFKISQETAALAAELEKLTEPLRSVVFHLIHVMVAQQVADKRPGKPKASSRPPSYLAQKPSV